MGADLLLHHVADTSNKLMKKKLKRFKRIMGHHTWPHKIAKIMNQAKPKFTALTHVLMFGEKSAKSLAKIKKISSLPVVMWQDLMEIMVSKNGSKVVKQGIATTH